MLQAPLEGTPVPLPALTDLPEPEPLVEQPGRVQKRVAMQPAEPRELGALEARDGAEDARLLAVLQLGLEADHVEQRAELVVLA